MKGFKTINIGIIGLIFIISTFNFGYASSVDYPREVNFINNSIVLITGFEPFGNYEINPSQLIAETLDGRLIDETEIVGIVLPVDFEKSIENITHAINQYNPYFVISLGLDAKTKTIDIEKLSINLKRYSKDEHMFWFIPRILDPGGPFFRFSTLKTKEIVEDLKDVNIPAKSSFFAGTYVCNSVFYQTMEYIDENDLSMQCGFIHVPLLDTQDPDGMKLETMIDAVTIAIQTNLD